MQEYIQMTSRHWASFWKVKAFCAVYFSTYTCIYKIKYWLKGYKEEQYIRFTFITLNENGITSYLRHIKSKVVCFTNWNRYLGDNLKFWHFNSEPTMRRLSILSRSLIWSTSLFDELISKMANSRSTKCVSLQV